jgi:hypothetical protein
MATYTIITTRPTGGASTYVVDYPADALVIADARQVLGEDVVAVSLARGTRHSSLTWLGSWRCVNGRARWIASQTAPFVPRPGRRGSSPQVVQT